jgi:hypothetical protein
MENQEFNWKHTAWIDRQWTTTFIHNTGFIPDVFQQQGAMYNS